MTKKSKITLASRQDCTGCAACASICPTNSIIMREDKEGFLQPHIDAKTCIRCRKCEKTCPIISPIKSLTNFETQACAAINNDETIRMRSSSGGIFYALAKWTIEQRGVVFGARFDEKWEVMHDYCETLDGIIPFMGSKYVQSRIGDTYKQARNFLEQGRWVLFSGTPCQLAGLRAFLGKQYERLIQVDLICHGVPSTAVWRKYLHELSIGGFITNVNFRDKKEGWIGNKIVIEKDGKTIVREKHMDDVFFRGFLKDVYLRRSCYNCQFRTYHRNSDITLGDYWGVDKYCPELFDNKGTSICFSHTEKGKCVLSKIADGLTIIQQSKEDATMQNPSMYKAIPDDSKRNLFFKRFDRTTFDRVASVIDMDKKESPKIVNKVKVLIRKFRTVWNTMSGNNDTYRIFIDNMGFVNKGDQLMIQSVLEQIRLYHPDAQVLLRKDAFIQNPTYCIKNRIYPLESKNSGKKHSKYYVRLVNLLLGDRWLTTPNQVDMILDCRGYHIADSWIKDESYCHFLENYYALFSKKNRKLVMLPQAFGPFGNEPSKKSMRFIHEQAHLIYAREQQSYDFIRELFPESNKIQIAPDFTCLCKPSESPSVQLPYKQYVLIIPNARMLDKTGDEVSSRYLVFLETIVSYLTQLGEKVYLLNHEGASDEDLMKELNNRLEKSVPMLTGLSGTDIKAIIRDSKLLISARFHGVVSGLTQGVPTLCTSWGHKYVELLREYGCEQSVLLVERMEEALRIIKDALLNPEKYAPKTRCIEETKKKTKRMWDDVFEVVKM